MKTYKVVLTKKNSLFRFTFMTYQRRNAAARCVDKLKQQFPGCSVIIVEGEE